MDYGQRGPVVVGVDDIVDARQALGYAAWQAHRRGVPLRLVHGSAAVPMYGPSLDSAHGIQTVLTGARQRLGHVAAEVRTRFPDLEVTTAVVAGAPGGVLVEESASACLVVVGARPAAGLFGMLTGSISAQVAAHAHAPVVVLRHPGGAPPADPWQLARGPVVVGVDATAGAAAALEFAFEEASARGSDLVPVYAMPPAPHRRARHPGQAGVDAGAVLAEALSGWANKYSDVPVHPRTVCDASVVHALLEAGDRAGLIVVGARTPSGLRGLLPGFIGDGLVRHSRRPVAVVPMPRDEPAAHL